jgi:penicillin-binding protein 1A
MKLFARILLYMVGFLALYTLILVGTYFAFNDHLPDIDNWSFEPKRVTHVLSADGQLLKDFLEENRELLTYEEIPKPMIDALIASEDQRFYSHWGIDVRRIFGSMLANLLSGRLVGQGGSTLTQQLARSIFAEVGQQRSAASLGAVMGTYARKVREQITAVQMERLYTKQEILTMYLNTVFFGFRCYGLKAATRLYFDKEVSALTVDECALLVGMLPAPNNYNPIKDPDEALRRRDQVLAAMHDTDRLSARDYQQLRRRPLKAGQSLRAATYDLGPYFIEHVRQQLEKEFGLGLYRNGMVVHTTLDSRLQRIAEKHFAVEIGKVQDQVDQYLARQGGRSGLPRTAMVQAAFVALDPGTGRVLAMIGGRDFEASKFNRATQAVRQAGSAFKPFVYTAAIDNNRLPTDLLDDNAAPIYDQGKLWNPENYDGEFLGPITLRTALARSRNLVAIKLAQEIGPALVRRYARNMGITTPIQAVPAIGVGATDVHLLDMAAAYAVFPNQGIYVEPVTVNRVVDPEGKTVREEKAGPRHQALRPEVAVVMTDMLRSVIDDEEGTGRAVRATYHLPVAAAGKTGTTNNYADAWFVGFTPNLVAGVWVGMDDPSLRLWPRQSGAVAALPLWAQFMGEVYRTVSPYRGWADRDFAYPEGLVERLSVCADSHKLATRFCPRQTREVFIRGEAMPPSCPLHGGGARPAARPRRF